MQFHRNGFNPGNYQIPDAVLLDYLEDHIVDDQEIDDITTRLGQLCQQHDVSLEISENDHTLLRKMVHHSVEHIRHQQDTAAKIEGNMCQINLQQVTQLMGGLLASGQVKIGGHDVAASPTKGGHIPTERPEDYDEQAPNLIDED